MSALCYCGSNQAYAACCELYLSGQKNAPTPEALMRSRYSAFARRKFAYLVRTMRGEAVQQFDLVAARRSAPLIKWLKLEVIRAEEYENMGLVEFNAHFRAQGKNSILHELSRFEKIDELWFYVGTNNK